MTFLSIMCLGKFLWVQYFWKSLGSLDLDVSFLPQIRGIFSNYVFKFKFSAPSSLYSFWHFYNTNVLWLQYLVLLFSISLLKFCLLTHSSPEMGEHLYDNYFELSGQLLIHLFKVFFFFNEALSCSFIWTIVLLLDSTY